MIIRTRAYARAGLIGNPSDGYFGKTISIICRNYAAEVCCYESPRLVIMPRGRDLLEFESIDIVQLAVALEQSFGQKGLPFEQLFMRDGDYVDEIFVSEVVDFMAGQLSGASSAA